MSAYSGVQDCFNRPLADVARSLGYSEANIVILEGDEIKFRTAFPDVYNNLLSCRHHADARTPFQYGQDLVASWLFEDTFLAALKKAPSFHVELDGADKRREILPSVRTSAASDYCVSTHDGNTRKLELMCDYTGFWARTGKLHLRDDKYKKMQASGSLFVAVSVTSKEFAIYDFLSNVSATYIPSHRLYGGKPAYELSINTEQMVPYTSEKLINEIAKALGA